MTPTLLRPVAALFLLAGVACRAEPPSVESSAAPSPDAASPVPALAPVEAVHRGLAWVAGQEITAAELQPALAVGATWIAQTPFGWMERPDEPGVRLATSGRVYWGEQDKGLVATHRLARAAGLRSALKPHLWIHDSWPGAVSMKSEEDWAAWFASYSTFLLHYAGLAESEGMDLLVIGTELKSTTATREADWRRLIASVRQVYHGPLTYAANWDEVEAVPFWDALDLIGVDAYFPLTTARSRAGSPETAQSLVEAWQPVLHRLESLSQRFGRRVLFTEAGYRSVARCTERPWESEGSDADPSCQAVAFEALFSALEQRPWSAGVWVWKWFPHRETAPSRPDFSPQALPAERVLARRWSVH